MKKMLTATGLAFFIMAAWVAFLPLVVAQAGPIAPITSILENFPGVDLNSDPETATPPDSNGAAGPNHFVEFINGAFAIYHKDGTPAQSLIPDTTFWTNAGINPSTIAAGLSDPRIIYDSASGRWFAAQITVDNTGNKVLVARSNTSDPTGVWKATSFTGNAGFADFPTLGLDANGVYVGTNNFTSSTGTFTGASLFSIPKSDLTASTPSVTHMTSFENLDPATRGATFQAAIDQNGSSGAILSTDATGSTFGTFYRATITGSGGPGAHLSATTPIAVTSDGSPGAARQSDGTMVIDAGDNRFSANVSQVGNLLFSARTISDNHVANLGTHDFIDWVIVNATTNTVVHEGTISDPNFDYFFPSIAANPNGNILLAFNRSGGVGSAPGGYISAFAEACQLTGGVVACGDPFLLRPGAGNFHLFGDLLFDPTIPERWGDYSTMSIDPNNPSDFWAIQEVPFQDTTGLGLETMWGTQITEIGFAGAVPEPSTFALMSLGLLGFAARRRRGRTPLA